MDVSQWGTARWTSMANAFHGAFALTGFTATDTPDLSRVMDMSKMFDGAGAFNGNISGWNVSAVTNMSIMFYDAYSFNGDISDWNVRAVTDMSGMFSGAEVFNGDISGWNVSAVTDMRFMFNATLAFNQNLGGWYISLGKVLSVPDGAMKTWTLEAQNTILSDQRPMYALEGADAADFALSGNTLTLKAPANRATKAFYTFTITATGTDLFVSSNSQELLITVGEADDATRPMVTDVSSNTAGDTLMVTFSEKVFDNETRPANFTLAGAASNPVVTAVVSSNTSPPVVTALVLSDAIFKGEEITLAYTSSAGSLVDDAGNMLADFADKVATNNRVLNPPVITSNGGSEAATIDVAENATAVTTVVATDADVADAITYTLSGADAELFTLNASTGVLTFKSAPDYELPASSAMSNDYTVIVSASDGMLTDPQTLTDMQTLSVTVTAVNEAPPIITSNEGKATATVSVAENETTVTTVVAADADVADAITYTLSGADAELFTLDASTGVLTFKSAPDYEMPASANMPATNVYTVIVSTSDGMLSDRQTLSVTVTNVINEEPPVITSNGGEATANVSVEENETVVTTVTARDPDGDTSDITYALSGADAELFTLDASTGVLTFKSAPDYELPKSSAMSNDYTVIVSASDGMLTDPQTLSVTVTAVNEAPPIITSNGGKATATVSVAENETTVTTVVAADADVADAITYTLSGADAELFTLDASTGVLTFKSAPDYEMPASANMPATNVYTVIVSASDGTLTSMQTLTITVSDVEETPLSVEALAGIVVYPNPSEGVIRLSGGKEAASYTLLDGSGQVLKKETLPAGKEDHTMTLAVLPAGVYFLHVQTGKKSFTQKVIKR